MKVTHVSASLSPNSAASRLIRAERSVGIDAKALFARAGEVPFPQSILMPMQHRSIAQRAWSKLEPYLFKLHPNRDRSLPWTGISSHLSLSESVKRNRTDLIHLHWIADGTLSLDTLSEHPIPMVWTFHDVWPITAGCHCNLGCERWLTGCMNCPQLGESSLPFSFSHYLWKKKKSEFKKIKNLTVITPSRWLGNMAKQSPFFQGRRIEVIPNCIDLDLFKPMEKAVQKERLGIPVDHQVILFGAIGGVSLGYKGYDLLLEALNQLKEAHHQKIHLLIFGSSDDGKQKLPFPTTFLGHIDREDELARVYNAADVFVGPSRQDNFPNVFLEAISCGIPCVGFDVGGIPEIVAHQQWGYIAEKFNTVDFARGIKWVLDHENPSLLSAQARTHAEENYSFATIAQKHIALYQELK